jgi:hypothetical protein
VDDSDAYLRHMRTPYFRWTNSLQDHRYLLRVLNVPHLFSK